MNRAQIREAFKALVIRWGGSLDPHAMFLILAKDFGFPKGQRDQIATELVGLVGDLVARGKADAETTGNAVADWILERTGALYD